MMKEKLLRISDKADGMTLISTAKKTSTPITCLLLTVALVVSVKKLYKSLWRESD